MESALVVDKRFRLRIDVTPTMTLPTLGMEATGAGRQAALAPIVGFYDNCASC